MSSRLSVGETGCVVPRQGFDGQLGSDRKRFRAHGFAPLTTGACVERATQGVARRPFGWALSVVGLVWQTVVGLCYKSVGYDARVPMHVCFPV